MVSLLPWSGNGYGKLGIKGRWSPVEACGQALEDTGVTVAANARRSGKKRKGRYERKDIVLCLLNAIKLIPRDRRSGLARVGGDNSVWASRGSCSQLWAGV